MKKDMRMRLYNVMFPVWMIYIMPTWLWLIILPVNFAVDSLVLLLAAMHYKLENKPTLWIKSIFKIWTIGFLSDFAGGGLSFGILFLCSLCNFDVGYYGTFFVAIPGVIFAGVLIYFANRWLSFRKTALDPVSVHRLSLALAIFTAPYTMLIPAYI